MTSPSSALALAGAIALSSLALGPASAADGTCELDRPVMFAGLDYQSAAFHTEVAKFITEHGYDCAVDDLPGSTIPLINGMARGDIDIVMEIWTANPAQAWVDAQERGEVVALGTTFPDAEEGWYVPTYLVEGGEAPAPNLKRASDLPEYAAMFEDPEEPSKGRFYNCPAGWQCEIVNTKKLTAYGLTSSYTNFRPGTGAALVAAVESAYLRKNPILFYYWTPTALMGKYDFVKLQEPEFNQEIWDEMLESDDPDAATAYPVSKVIIGANKTFAESAPELAKFLTAYSMTSKMTSAALADMEDNGGDAAVAAEAFLKANEDVWSGWVPQAVADKVKAAL
ncbi:ABC transporter substrate-binding protein [Amorphus orientalis]|uniref:Glycine betaine/proline transport system substrate-binding protein n=1 Tax=Amorphus orientalis TaxID=649198 RepID=A0AAE3VKX7_9HYPH|nr:ABC transporter substrate-binding protein [Amorphus orientalis]MDQ0314059.1 glycine betaine/proline transport system substrate-binding protein [Amorphus orientalis]